MVLTRSWRGFRETRVRARASYTPLHARDFDAVGGGGGGVVVVSLDRLVADAQILFALRELCEPLLVRALFLECCAVAAESDVVLRDDSLSPLLSSL